MPKKLYFGHPVNVYGTDLEKKLLEKIAADFPDWNIENPNQKNHQEGYEYWSVASWDRTLLENLINEIKQLTETIKPAQF